MEQKITFTFTKVEDHIVKIGIDTHANVSFLKELGTSIASATNSLIKTLLEKSNGTKFYKTALMYVAGDFVHEINAYVQDKPSEGIIIETENKTPVINKCGFVDSDCNECDISSDCPFNKANKEQTNEAK